MEPPKLILGEIDRTSAILRDILNPSFENVYVNDITLSKEIRHFLSTIAPEKQDIVKYVSPEIPILVILEWSNKLNLHWEKRFLLKTVLT